MICGLTPRTPQTLGRQARSNSPAPSTNQPPSHAVFESTIPRRLARVDAAKLAEAQKELSGQEYVPGELLVRMQSGLDLLSDYGAKTAERFTLSPDSGQDELVRIKLPAGLDMAEAMASLRSDERVRYAEPNQIIRLPDTTVGDSELSGNIQDEGRPNDLKSELWGLRNEGQTGGTKGADIDAQGAWEIGTGDWNGPLIAVIDTGVDYRHEDLSANIWKNKGEIPADGIDNDGNGVIDDVYGYNADENNGDPMDVHGHGTHCAGTIAAVGDNGKGVVGVNWKANLLPIRVFNRNGTGNAASIIRGVLYANQMGADITNNSWTSALHNQAIEDAFAAAPEAIHIAAAGNNSYNTDRRPLYPMGFELPNVVSVGATDHNDTRAEFSNYGPQTVDVTAPGKNIYSTAPGNDYQFMSGTSMATPHVTGLVALLKSTYPDLTNQQVIDRLHFSSDRVDTLAEISGSGGRVNAARSMEEDNVSPARPNDFTATPHNSRRVQLGWTATGDDHWCGGRNVAYEVFVSDQPLTPENLTQAPRHFSGTSGEIGQLERLAVEFTADHEKSRNYYAAMRMVDNVGNRSQLSTSSFKVPAATLHLGEAQSGQWTAEGTWQQVEVEGRGKVWATNAPGEEYGNNLQMLLTSPVIDLSQAKESMLSYEANYALAPGDTVFVEVSADGGENWKSVRAMSRRSGEDWRYSEVDLSRYDGEKIQVRMRLKTDEQGGSAGARIDNFRVVSN